ncbi:hypothetical protein [Xanthomonas sp. GPE 39]|uniref:hypothetical protein n=1 Tax=Xanthomonas sp. GPE 39 TaxID=1583099 RepID=UPI001269C5B0|nr:hypothetical protein [Xanthomonas sp. GPE 39]
MHQRIQAGPLRQSTDRLRDINDTLTAIQAEREALLQRQRQAQGSAEQQLLIHLLMSEKATSLRTLKAERDDLLSRLDPRYTYDTSAPWATDVPRQPAFPNSVLVLGLALLLGGGGGVLAAVIRNALRRRQACAASHTIATSQAV